VRPSAVLVAVIASAAVVGIAISAAQRPPSATPSPTHAPTPRPEPTAIPSAPVTGIGFTVADDPATGQVVLFGGVGDGANTWLWVAGHWVLARPPTSPPGRIDASAAYDPETEQVLLFGGGDARVNGSPSFDDTWAWDGYTWTELERLSHGEPIGEGSSMAWDDALDEMVLVTSADDTSGNDETWVWSGSGWVLQVQGDVAPSAFDLAMAFDPVTRSLIAEGCCATPQSPLGALDTTWRWNGRRWIQLAGTAEPPAGFIPRPRSVDGPSRALQLRSDAGAAGTRLVDGNEVGTHERRPPADRAGGGDHRRRDRSAGARGVGHAEQPVRGPSRSTSGRLTGPRGGSSTPPSAETGDSRPDVTGW
jgi:hypothetical protein